MEDLKQTANELSMKISDVISPLTPETAPIAAAILEGYVQGIKSDEHFPVEAYHFF